jgi:hypothetical protein
VVVKGVQIDVELVGLDSLVSSSQSRLDSPGLTVVETRANIECVLSDEHPDLGALGSRPALRRLGLGETGRRFGHGPRALIEPAINCDGALDPGGPDLGRGGMAVARSRVGRGGCLVLEGGQDGERERDR